MMLLYWECPAMIVFQIIRKNKEQWQKTAVSAQKVQDVTLLEIPIVLK